MVYKILSYEDMEGYDKVLLGKLTSIREKYDTSNVNVIKLPFFYYAQIVWLGIKDLVSTIRADIDIVNQCKMVCNIFHTMKGHDMVGDFEYKCVLEFMSALLHLKYHHLVLSLLENELSSELATGKFDLLYSVARYLSTNDKQAILEKLNPEFQEQLLLIVKEFEKMENMVPDKLIANKSPSPV